MNSKDFSDLEIDAIGEILNISLGASATAVSTMLDGRVEITTPVVKVVSKEEFEFKNLEPACAVEITYISGLNGSNIMLLKRHDIKVIVELLMKTEISDEDFEIDEMNISAICEVMNQMMGASATALSEFLNKSVNISTPKFFEIKDEQGFTEKYFTENNDSMVVVGFTLKIMDRLESEFINLMSPELAKELLTGFLSETSSNSGILELNQESLDPEPESSSDRMLSQDEIEKLMNNSLASAEASEAAPAQPEQPAQQQEPVQPVVQAAQAQPSTPVLQAAPAQAQMPGQPDMNAGSSQVQLAQMQQMMQQQMQLMQQMMQQRTAPPKTIEVQPMPQPNLNVGNPAGGEEQENMDLILSVPLDISVEIGRTKKMVKDILEFSKGSLVVLDKVAGEQVDLFVNGQCIAKGDVVVIEDNFGIRITEIIKKDIMNVSE